MNLDPVLAELCRLREEFASHFKGGVAPMMADIRRREQESSRRMVFLERKLVFQAGRLEHVRLT